MEATEKQKKYIRFLAKKLGDDCIAGKPLGESWKRYGLNKYEYNMTPDDFFSYLTLRDASKIIDKMKFYYEKEKKSYPPF